MTKPRILATWELGANFGHVTKIARALEPLQDEADLFLALRETWQLRQIAPELRCTLLPAPYAPTRALGKDEPQARNYAGILLTEGWETSAQLSGLVEAWRGLFEMVKPDLLLAQSSPTAILAARALKMKTAVLGGGYDTPPLAHPMPLFGLAPPDQTAADLEIAKQQESQALASANEVLSRIDAPTADRFCDLIRTDESLLVCWPFNDHYGDRSKIEPGHAPYLGSAISKSSGENIAWAKDQGTKIFAYLRPGSVTAPHGLRALASLGPKHDIICSAPRIPENGKAILEKQGVQVADGPVFLDPLLDECDLCLSHGSPGIVSAFLMAGVRQVALPNHREQSMHMRAVARHGLMVGLEGQFGPEAVVKCIESLLSDQAALRRVREAADRISNQFPNDPGTSAAAILRSLIG